MPNYNSVALMGNLTRDPELRVTPKGTAICQFTLAVNRKWKDESQQEREEVSFIDCEAWGRAGENIAKYVTKGRPLFVAGRLKQDTWEDKNTKEKRSKIKVVVAEFQFLGESKPAAAPARRDEAPASTAPAQQENLDEDCPF